MSYELQGYLLVPGQWFVEEMFEGNVEELMGDGPHTPHGPSPCLGIVDVS